MHIAEDQPHHGHQDERNDQAPKPHRSSSFVHWVARHDVHLQPSRVKVMVQSVMALTLESSNTAPSIRRTVSSRRQVVIDAMSPSIFVDSMRYRRDPRDDATIPALVRFSMRSVSSRCSSEPGTARSSMTQSRGRRPHRTRVVISASNASATSDVSNVSCGTVDVTIEMGVVGTIVVEVGSSSMGASTTTPPGRPHDDMTAINVPNTRIPEVIGDRPFRMCSSSPPSGWVSVRSPWRCSCDRA